MRMKISNNFDLEEFCGDANVSDEYIENVRYFVENLLQPIRDRISFPFNVVKIDDNGNENRNNEIASGLAANIDLGSKQLNNILWEEIMFGKFEFDQVININDFSYIYISIKKDKKDNDKSMFKVTYKRD